MKERNKNDPKFKFLYDNDNLNGYYKWKKMSLIHNKQQQQQHQQQHNAMMNNIIEFENILKTLNGSKNSIKSVSKYILNHTNNLILMCNIIENRIYMLNHEQFNDKLHIIYVINDVLHELTNNVKLNTNLSFNMKFCLSQLLLKILGRCFINYDKNKQNIIHNLIKLWNERFIFDKNITLALQNSLTMGVPTPMININPPPNPIQNPPNLLIPPTNINIELPQKAKEAMERINSVVSKQTNNTNQPNNNDNSKSIGNIIPNIPPSMLSSLKNNSLLTTFDSVNAKNIPVTILVDIALDLRRKGCGGTFIPIPIKELLNLNINQYKYVNRYYKPHIRKLYNEFQNEMELIDPNFIKKRMDNYNNNSNNDNNNENNKRHYKDRDYKQQ